MRRKVIAGNWKMNKSPKDVEEFMERFPGLVSDTENEVILCVPFIDLCKAVKLSKGTNVKIGAQICTLKIVEHIQEKSLLRCLMI